ncbi:sce7726 family protein [Hyphomicrobium denitrificans]|nr:sce7726 family protein [Hyphomicrobium denitrificans]
MRDSDVREALRARLGAEHAGASDTRLVEEMGIWSGTVRIDVAVINGELSGYELKSDSDTLERLPAQADIYGKVFDRMTLVVGSKHAKKALKIIPKWWGCLEARVSDNRLVLKHKRKARINPGRDAKIIAQLLWKEEALAILDFHGLAGGWRSRRSAEILERLVERIPFASLTAHVRAALKARPSLGQRVACDLNMPIEASET